MNRALNLQTVLQYKFEGSMQENQTRQDRQFGNKIVALLDNLQSTGQRSQDSKCEQIKEFKMSMTKTLDELREKLSSATSVLDEVEREALELTTEKKNKLSTSAHLQDKFHDIQQEFQEIYQSNMLIKQNLDRKFHQKILELKLSVTEQQDRQNYDVSYLSTEQLPSRLSQLTANKSSGDKAKLKLQQTKDSINERLAKLKKQSSEANQSMKSQLKKQKNTLIKITQNIAIQIAEEERAVQKSFDFHLETLKKIVASVTEKLS